VRLGHYIVLDYPPSAGTAHRVRARGALFEVVDAHAAEYREQLRMIGGYAEDLAKISVRSDDPRRPSWVNEFLPGLDSSAIYGFLRSRNPSTYLEVGSGNSTAFARQAIADGRLRTSIVSVDPNPRADVDKLCDAVVRQPFELVDGRLLPQLKTGDVVFLDGSHRAFTGSDATVFFLDFLPSLAPGVLVGVHDVYLPDDYPEGISERYYSEQYLLGALLLGRPNWLRPVLAAHYVSSRDGFGELDGLWATPELRGVETHGVGFWLETC
jgi:hypothetical protein